LSRWRTDCLVGPALLVAALLVAAVLGLVVFFLFNEAWPVLHEQGWQRFWSGEWQPAEGRYNLVPMMAGTMLASLAAMLLAAPLGVASALFCRYYAPPRLARLYRGMIGLLAGIPSVVFGFWGLTVLVPLVGEWQPPGASLLTASFILALMILPTVAASSEAALSAVPAAYRQGASALGLSLRASIVGVLLPGARAGIFAGLMLSMARALGETMAVMMVAGNVVQIPESLFDPMRTLTANIALEMAYATGDHRGALFVSGLALIIMALVLSSLAMQARRAHQHA
jgi:phosphate transport system permease protein